MGFFPANAFQIRNNHNYSADALDEKSMYFSTENLIRFLSSWSCDPSKRLFECMRELSQEMANHGFWGDKDIEVIDSWLTDLSELGYPEPDRVKVNMTISHNVSQSMKILESSGYLDRNPRLAYQWFYATKKRKLCDIRAC